MVKRTHGLRGGTRRKLSKPVRERGKIKIRAHLQTFNIGDNVHIKVDSAVQKGMPFKRFFGKQGKVIEQRGNAYVISVKEGGKTKSVICAPVHLRKL
ncbi:MAG: 50S ribosomal protein L21e [Candidatus Nanoarchaeia archaeon]|nr:50S ribosomal protein L21e [Candidatus Nanoarchaeia archaeon]MDD5239603.1 50S ribosomal protein L21e [Candidatus Nanoarchaeia archaeon]